MLAYSLILFSLILVNGLFAMAELAVFSSRPTRLKQMAEAGNKGARAALRLLDDPTRFLSTAQFGISLISVLLGVYSGARFAKPIGQWLAGFELLALLAAAGYFFSSWRFTTRWPECFWCSRASANSRSTSCP